MASPQTEVDRAFLSRIPIFAGLPDRVMEVIAEKLRNLISVCSVDLQAADSAWIAAAQAAG